MQIVTSFVGKNRDFRAWLREEGTTRRLVGELVAAVACGKIVSLAEYREKRKSRSGRAAAKSTSPIIA